MSGFKDPSYLDRKSAATDARKAALEKFRARLSTNEAAADAVTKTAKSVAFAGKAPEAKADKTPSEKTQSKKLESSKAAGSKPAKSRGK